VHLWGQIACVAFGSALGGLARWGVGLGVGRWLGGEFPWGTLFINVSGSFVLGWVATLLTERLANGVFWLSADHLRLLLTVGFAGAYTTFSTFEFETNNLLRDGDGLKVMTYVFGSLFLGLVALRLGMWLARQPGGQP
jgi:fluoride exporter